MASELKFKKVNKIWDEIGTSKIIIFSPESESESAKNLGIGEVLTSSKGFNYEGLKNYIIFRNGYSGFVRNAEEKKVEFNNVINPASQILINVEKNQSVRLLSKHVLVPTMYDAGQKVPFGKTIVVRPVNHSAGKDFQVVEVKDKNYIVPAAHYAKEFIKTNFECRVWYAGGKMMMGRRVSKNAKRLAEKYKCRSKWPYSYCSEVPKDLQEIVKNAFQVIKLDIGAADIIHKAGKWYILELNSAASIDAPILIKWMRNAIKELIKNKFPNLNVIYG